MTGAVSRQRIFVYGTLKRGGENHHVLATQTYVGEARTQPGYRLYRLDGYPGMITAPRNAGVVTGEVWEVDDDTLAALDALEGVAEGLYERVPVRLEPPFADQRVETYLYLHDLTGRDETPGTWPV